MPRALASFLRYSAANVNAAASDTGEYLSQLPWKGLGARRCDRDDRDDASVLAALDRTLALLPNAPRTRAAILTLAVRTGAGLPGPLRFLAWKGRRRARAHGVMLPDWWRIRLAIRRTGWGERVAELAGAGKGRYRGRVPSLPDGVVVPATSVHPVAQLSASAFTLQPSGQGLAKAMAALKAGAVVAVRVVESAPGEVIVVESALQRALRAARGS